MSTLWTAAWGDEKTREVITEQVIEIFKSSEYQDFDELFSCRLIYLLGETKTDLAKEYLLNTKEKENNELLRGCMISSLRNKLDVDI